MTAQCCVGSGAPPILCVIPRPMIVFSANHVPVAPTEDQRGSESVSSPYTYMTSPHQQQNWTSWHDLEVLTSNGMPPNLNRPQLSVDIGLPLGHHIGFMSQSHGMGEVALGFESFLSAAVETFLPICISQSAQGQNTTVYILGHEYYMKEPILSVIDDEDFSPSPPPCSSFAFFASSVLGMFSGAISRSRCFLDRLVGKGMLRGMRFMKAECVCYEEVHICTNTSKSLEAGGCT
jgi:hypothetical protein